MRLLCNRNTSNIQICIFRYCMNGLVPPSSSFWSLHGIYCIHKIIMMFIFWSNKEEEVKKNCICLMWYAVLFFSYFSHPLIRNKSFFSCTCSVSCVFIHLSQHFSQKRIFFVELFHFSFFGASRFCMEMSVYCVVLCDMMAMRTNATIYFWKWYIRKAKIVIANVILN